MPLSGAWYYQNGTVCTTSTACTTVPTWIPTCSGGTASSCTNTIITTTVSSTDDTIYRLWVDQQERRIHHPPPPTDQELYQKAVAEHNVQEAERLRYQIDRRDRLETERLRLQRQQNDEREVAKKRANEFLLEHLTKQQQETFKKNGWFVVEGGRTKTKYRIRSNGLVGNIDVYKDDTIIHRLCGHVPTNKVPIGDQLLAQKMMLESSEDDFLRIANRHP